MPRVSFVTLAVLLLPRLLWGQCPDGAPPPCGRAPVAAASPSSVAVLYFDNLSRDTSDAYLADGFTEELISRLSQVERLQVKSRTAVLRYRGRQTDPAAMGRSLSVAHLVSGSILRAGSRLRVNVELTRASTGVSLWSRTFERPAADLIAVEGEIAESVAVGVSGRLAPAERRRIEARPTTNAAAYDHYLRGNFEAARRTTSAILRAIREYEAAIALDPRYAAPMVRAAIAYSSLSALYRGPELDLPRDTLLARAKALLDRAVRIDSTSADAWMARATLNIQSARQRRDAYNRAVALDPNNAEAHHQFAIFLRDYGDDSTAVFEFHRALTLEPERPISLLNLGQTYLGMRQFGEAMRWIDSAVALRPEAAFYYMEQGLSRLALGDTSRARVAAEAVGSHGNANGRDELLAMIEARAGDSAAARARITRVDAAMRQADCWVSHPCLELGMALAAVGLREQALAVVERLTPREQWFVFWAGLAEFDPIRQEPRFQAVMAEARRRSSSN